MTDIKTVRSSVIDGIAVTPRYRERQLASLHKALSDSRSSLIKTIADETTLTTSEATVQFLLTLKAIKTYHTAVNPQTCQEKEYLLSKAKNHELNRSPYGCAYIIPSQIDSFYSTIVPVAAAIAAGNCVVVEIPQTASKLSGEIRKLLITAIQRDTFAIADKLPFDEDFVTKHCVVLDGRDSSDSATSRYILTRPDRVAFVVDRSADIATAAKECVKARFGFGGRSAYAPDIVLVNEFCVQAFCTAVAERALQYFSGHANGDLKTIAPARKHKGLDSALQDKLQASSAQVVVSGDKGTIALLKSRDSELLSTKMNSPLLLIVPISSMDDAINLHSGKSLRASYLFCAPAAAKYLSQFIASSITSVNHVPTELLVGPPAPEAYITSMEPRYTTDMFSVPHPELIEVSPLAKNLSTIVSQDTASKERKQAEESIDIKLERVAEPFGPSVGFFEQGLLFGVACILAAVVTGTTLSVKYGYPALISRLR